ncbi:hypothetical protein [Sphingomonas sp. VDB2]
MDEAFALSALRQFQESLWPPAAKRKGKIMAALSADERRDHFAHCVQLFGGITSFSRRLGIDERAIRRFINGERALSDGLLADTATALRQLIAESTVAEEQISQMMRAEPRP